MKIVVETWDAKARPTIKKCGRCGREFANGATPEKFKVIERQVSNFRGEDEVYALCLNCWSNIKEWALPAVIELGIIKEASE